MANTKKKNHYYVLVFSNNGPAYVTSVDYADRSARWDKNAIPKEFSKSDAENLVFGLCCNFFNAVVVMHPVEIDCQPYNYRHWECKFVEKQTNDEEEGEIE
jgi:hypothetical protein